MANKVNAPDGPYEGHLVEASYSTKGEGNVILDLMFDIGNEYFWAKESIFVVSAPTGDAATDKQRREWTSNSVKRISEVYPEAVRGGGLSIMALCNATDEMKSKTVKVKVRTDANGYSKATCYPLKNSKKTISAEEVKKALSSYSRSLASVGVVIGEMSASANASVSADDANSDIPF